MVRLGFEAVLRIELEDRSAPERARGATLLERSSVRTSGVLRKISPHLLADVPVLQPSLHPEAEGSPHRDAPGTEAGAARYGIAGRDFLVILTFMPSTTYRYLTQVPGVRSGRTLIEGTRIGVHDVVGLVVNGSSVDEVCRSFPGVTRAQVYECLSYYEDHRVEIDALVVQQMSEGPA